MEEAKVFQLSYTNAPSALNTHHTTHRSFIEHKLKKTPIAISHTPQNRLRTHHSVKDKYQQNHLNIHHNKQNKNPLISIFER